VKSNAINVNLPEGNKLPASENPIFERYLLLSDTLISALEAGNISELHILLDERDVALDILIESDFDGITQQELQHAIALEKQFQSILAAETKVVRDAMMAEYRDRIAAAKYRSNDQDNGGSGEQSIAC